MNTRQYLYIYTLATSSTISEAAEHLGISEAALSKFLKAQEQYFHVRFFSRDKKQLRLTAAGQVVFQAARRILEVKSNTLSAMARQSDPTRFSVRIASTPYRGTELYSQIYNRFLSLFPSAAPQVEEIYSNQQEAAIHARRVDFAFGVGIHAAHPDVCNLAASRTELVLAVPRFHPLAAEASRDLDHLSSVSVSAFENTPFIMRDRKNNIRLEADKVFAAARFSPVIAFESTNAITVESMIRKGAGVGFFSRRYVHPESDLVFFRLDPPCYETFYIRYAKDRKLTDEDKCLIAIIFEERLNIRGSEPVESDFIRACTDLLLATENGRGI